MNFNDAARNPLALPEDSRSLKVSGMYRLSAIPARRSAMISPPLREVEERGEERRHVLTIYLHQASGFAVGR